MSAIPPETRTLLTELRNLMLEQHTVLLDREKGRYELANGPIPGPGAFLNLLLNDPHFAWLRSISALVAEIDEALSRKSTAGPAEAEALLAQVSTLMTPRETGPDFQLRYYQAVQESPDVVIGQVRIERLLGR